MGTAQGNVKKQKLTENKTKQALSFPSQGCTSAHGKDGPGLGIFIFIHLTLSSFSYLSFGHELRTGLVNKQVIGRERVGKVWGREVTPDPGGPGAGRALYRREDEPVRWGDTVSGGSLEPHCLRSIYMHSPRRGQAYPSTHRAPGGSQAISPSDGDTRAQFGPLCRSVQCGLLFTDTKAGRHIPGESQDSPGSHNCPESSVGSAL